MADLDELTTDAPRRGLPSLLYVRQLAEDRDERAIRFAVTHPYVERCWLPVIGPSGTWCLRRLGAELAAHPQGTAIDVADLARDLGLSGRLGEMAPLNRTLQRLCDFNLARFGEHDTFEVRTAVPTLGRHALARLSREAQEVHREMVSEASNPFLAAALDYARHGLPVLPLRSAEKMPDGRLVPHGLTDATTDESLIRRWWTTSPRANVGIRTGGGIDVVDLDSPAARLTLEDLAPEPLRPGVIVRTARGWHLWFASCGLPTRAAVMEGIDVRGAGGYVVAPPSVHPDGHRYAFLDERTGELTPQLPEARLTPAPEWLMDELRPVRRTPPEPREPIRLRSSHYVRVAVDAECQAVATTTEGSRNHRLNRAAFSLGTLVGAKVLDVEDARAHLLDAALRAGLEQPEALRTIASGLSAGERQPRRGIEEPANGNGVRQRARTTAQLDRGQRSPDPSRRPDESANAAVLARARSAASSPVHRAVTSLPPQRGIGR